MAGVLILGGTAEARSLAGALVELGVAVTSSLAGRVSRPALPVGEVRIGGFGGPGGLAAWLAANPPSCVVDATHPFAARISASAVVACEAEKVPLLRLARPPWHAGPGDDWRHVSTIEDAADSLPLLGSRPFLTTGRGGLEHFAERPGIAALARCVDRPDLALPDGWRLILDRGPYTTAGESALMRDHRADVLVTKNSGGALTVAKLAAARELGLPVVVVDRPPSAGAPEVEDVAEAVAWVSARAPGGG